jgi:hypothetical protein
MNYPNHEIPIRRRLGEAMIKFVKKITTNFIYTDRPDHVLRQVATEKYRREVEKAAAKGVEVSLAWHTLATWTEDGRERIGYFSRALDCRRRESAERPLKTAQEKWSATQTEASCLYEIGRIHAHEGLPEVARKFLTEALFLAQKADTLSEAVGATGDRLEGQIAELLLQLPDDDGTPQSAGKGEC